MLTEKLAFGMRVLFVGFNPSLRSYELGFNYAGRSNRFYNILYRSGLTDRLYAAEESFNLLRDCGYGFTNLAARPTRTAAEITRDEYRVGAAALKEKLALYRPLVACFVGKGVYAAYSGRRAGVPWGFAADDQVDGVRDFVAPSTSGLVRMTFAEQTAVYRLLAAALPA